MVAAPFMFWCDVAHLIKFLKSLLHFLMKIVFIDRSDSFME